MESARWALVMDIGWTSFGEDFMGKITFGLSFCQEIVGVTHGLEHNEGAMARAITRSYTLPEWECKTCISPMMD
jgi:hypothetical protein